MTIKLVEMWVCVRVGVKCTWDGRMVVGMLVVPPLTYNPQLHPSHPSYRATQPTCLPTNSLAKAGRVVGWLGMRLEEITSNEDEGCWLGGL